MDFADYNREVIVSDSSRITNIKYSHESAEMLVKFKDGTLYQYTGVSEELFAAIASARSIGRVFKPLMQHVDYKKVN